MEQVESIPFSVLIAGILLYKRRYRAKEIVNIVSELERRGIVIDDENDDFSQISCCVEMGKNYDFYLKNRLDYDTVLSSGVKVFDFLKMFVGEQVQSVLDENLKDFILQPQELKMIEHEKVLENIMDMETFSLKPKSLTKQRKFSQHISFSRKNLNFDQVIL